MLKLRFPFGGVWLEVYGDYHTHCRNSDGRQTVEQILRAASHRGLKEVAVTDHGPLAAVIGVKNPEVYLGLKQEADEINAAGSEVKLLVGAEANIRDRQGTLDLPAYVINELDILIVGLHPYTLPTSVKEGFELYARNSLRHLGPGQRRKAIDANTKAMVEALNHNPQIDILSHPGLFFTVDVEEVARACIKNDVFFEINCGHEHPPVSDIMKAETTGVNFIINSDAHFEDTVGQLDYGIEIVSRIGIEPDRVINLGKGGGYVEWCKKKKACRYS